MHRWEAPPRAANPKRAKRQQDFLIRRMIEAGCDIVAVQEISGRSDKVALGHLRAFASALSSADARQYIAYIGAAPGSNIRNGFLVATERAHVLRQESYVMRNLPKLQPLGPERRSLRGPDALIVSVRDREADRSYELAVLTMHFKSKVAGWKDPSRTEFEATRMEMAEGLRRIAEELASEVGEDGAVVILGDRNSDPDSASAAILSGSRSLADFLGGVCILRGAGRPICREASHEASFVALFGGEDVRVPGERGSYRYRGHVSYLDGALISADDVPLVLGSDGNFVAGVVGAFNKGSDHKLLWIELNW